MRIISKYITQELTGRSVYSIMKNELNMSSSFIGRTKLRSDGITVGGAQVYTNRRVSAGETLSVRIDDEGISAFPQYKMPLDILYEDDDLIIINKPAGIAVHDKSSGGKPTIGGALAYYLDGTPFHPVSRLDKGTTGVMAIAKNGYIHDRLRKIMHTDDFFREYLAVTVGSPPQNHGIVDLPIARVPGSAIKHKCTPEGSCAYTEYHVISHKNGYSLVRLAPKTGRTHQIRLHMAALGCPLAGDWLYGKEDPDLIPRPALHSARLVMIHPLSGKKIDISAPLPNDMEKFK